MTQPVSASRASRVRPHVLPRWFRRLLIYRLTPPGYCRHRPTSMAATALGAFWTAAGRHGDYRLVHWATARLPRACRRQRRHLLGGDGDTGDTLARVPVAAARSPRRPGRGVAPAGMRMRVT